MHEGENGVEYAARIVYDSEGLNRQVIEIGSYSEFSVKD
jgi:hypothetical protein